MKLILYIGHHKVGSTSLQAFLAQNAQALLGSGILYPMVDARGLIHMLRQSAGLVDRPGQLPPHLREPHSALAYRMIADVARRPVPPQFAAMLPLKAMIETLKVQLTRLEPHTVIMCTEVFANFGEVDERLIDRVLMLFPKVTQMQIYCALRRPDQYLVSWHGQRLKVGEVLPPVAEAAPGYFGTVHFDYALALRGWIARCGDARITLRDYAQIMETGNSVRDFRRHAMVDWPKGLVPPPRINPSLPLPVMEIARRANATLPAAAAGRLRTWLIGAGARLDLPPNDSVDMLGPDVRADLLARFRPVQAWLDGVAGTNGFFSTLEEITECPPVPQADAVRAALSQMTPDVLPAALPPRVRAFVADLRREYGIG